jgi:hypothetical protein
MLVVPVNNDVYIRIKKIKKKNDVYITFGSKRRMMYTFRSKRSKIEKKNDIYITFGLKRRMMYTFRSKR